MQRASRWIRLAIQGLGVTASVLLALAVDASWGYRQDRSEEREALLRLDADFRRNRDLLDEARREHARILGEAYALLADLDRLRADATYRVPDTLLATLWDWKTYDPVGGTLTSLIASGRLGLIRNDSLRASLASWPGVVADLNEDEVSQRDAVREHVVPFLAERVPFRRLLGGELARIGSPAASRESTGLRAALLDPELENWIIDRIQGKEALLGPGRELDQVQVDLDAIVSLVGREIARGSR